MDLMEKLNNRTHEVERRIGEELERRECVSNLMKIHFKYVWKLAYNNKQKSKAGKNSRNKIGKKSI